MTGGLRLPPLLAFGSALDGWLCSNHVGQDICATCWAWWQPTYWKPIQLVWLQVQEYWPPFHPVSPWSGLLKLLVHGEVDVLQVGLCHQWQCGTRLGGHPSLQRHLCIPLEGQQFLLLHLCWGYLWYHWNLRGYVVINCDKSQFNTGAVR